MAAPTTAIVVYVVITGSTAILSLMPTPRLGQWRLARLRLTNYR